MNTRLPADATQVAEAANRFIMATLRWPGILMFFLVAAIIQTWPLVLHAGNRTTHYPGQPGDTAVFLWDLWWMKESIIHLHTNPFHTDYLFFPQGTDLYLHPLNPLNGILSIPLQLVTGNLLLSWNVLLLAFLTLSALGMYALVHRITHDDAAAAVSGFVFAFAPSTMMHLQGGQWNIATTWPLPFFVLFLLRIRESARLRDALAAGIFGAVITYNWIEFGLDAALFLALYAAYSTYRAWRTGDRGRIVRLWWAFGGVVAVWALLCAPFAIAAWINVHREGYEIVAGVEYWSADLRAFITRSPLWGSGKDPIFPVGQHLGIGSPLGTWYLGFVALALALFGVFASRQSRSRALFWTAVALIFIVLALGPYLYIDGVKSSITIPCRTFSIALPYQLYDKLPVFGERRIPARMLTFGVLALSVLAGIGSSALFGWVKQRWQLATPLAAAIILTLVTVDYWNPPTSLSSFQKPAILEKIASEPGDFSVLQLPVGRAAGNTVAGDSSGGYIVNYYQTIYKKRSFGGYIARGSSPTVAWIAQQPGFGYLACTPCAEPIVKEDVDPGVIRGEFLQYSIKYVIIHKLYPDGQPALLDPKTIERWDAYLRDVAGLELTYEAPELSVYRNPEVK